MWFSIHLLPLVVPPDDLDLVVLPDGHGADAVLLAQLLGERRAHEHAAHVRRRLEVALALLAPGGGHVLVQLHGGVLWKRSCQVSVSDLSREISPRRRRRSASHCCWRSAGANAWGGARRRQGEGRTSAPTFLRRLRYDCTAKKGVKTGFQKKYKTSG